MSSQQPWPRHTLNSFKSNSKSSLNNRSHLADYKCTHLESESKAEQNVWTRIYKRAELGLLFQALVGTFPSITTVLTDRAFRSMPNSQSSPNKRDLASLHTSQSLHIFSITHIMSTNSDSLKQTKMASFTHSCEWSSPQQLMRLVYCKCCRIAKSKI